MNCRQPSSLHRVFLWRFHCPWQYAVWIIYDFSMLSWLLGRMPGVSLSDVWGNGLCCPSIRGETKQILCISKQLSRSHTKTQTTWLSVLLTTRWRFKGSQFVVGRKNLVLVQLCEIKEERGDMKLSFSKHRIRPSIMKWRTDALHLKFEN